MDNNTPFLKWIGKPALILTFLASLILGSLFLLAPATAAQSQADTKWYLRDQDVGIQLIGNTDNTGKAIYCVTPDDCKIVYYDHTNGDLKFFDCDDAACSTGTASTVDSVNDVGDQLSIYCVSATDCKIAYYDTTNSALLFHDCDEDGGREAEGLVLKAAQEGSGLLDQVGDLVQERRVFENAPAHAVGQLGGLVRDDGAPLLRIGHDAVLGQQSQVVLGARNLELGGGMVERDRRAIVARSRTGRLQSGRSSGC